MLLRRGFGALVAIALVMGACGGDDAGGGLSLSELEETLSDLPEDGRSPEELQADTDRAAKAVLVLSDLPEGWSGEPPEDDEDEPMPPGLLECLGVPESARGEFEDDDTPAAESDDFSLDDAETSSEVFVYASPEVAEAGFLFFEIDNLGDCFEKALREQFASDPEMQGLPIEITEMEIDLVDPPDVGDRAVALRMRFSMSALDQEFRFQGEFWSVQVGRSVATLEFFNVGGPFDRALAVGLAEVVVDRMQEI